MAQEAMGSFVTFTFHIAVPVSALAILLQIHFPIMGWQGKAIQVHDPRLPIQDGIHGCWLVWSSNVYCGHLGRELTDG